MHGSSLGCSWRDGVAAGTLALALTLAGGLPAAAMDERAIEAAIPVPTAADVPPPTAADVAAAAPAAEQPTAAAETTASTGKPDQPAAAAAVATPAPAIDPADIAGAIPLPEPADVPPPTLKDLGTMPLGRMAEADQPVGEQLRDILTDRADKLFPLKAERAAVEAFYKARGYVPVWVENGAPAARMRAAVARLHAAGADGLDAKDFPTPDLAAATTPQALAEAELKLTLSLLAYARRASGGQVNPARISTNIEFSPPTPDAGKVLDALAATKDVAATLDGYNPPHAGYKALKAKLAELRGATADEPEAVQIPAGKLLRPGMRDARVSLLRERLKVPPGEAGDVYDEALLDAVKAFQKRKGLAADGIVGSGTVNALNGRRKLHLVDAVLSNMERWRWLPRDLGTSYVMVNIPDYSLRLVHNGTAVFKTRIVVGKPNTPSPSFSAKIETIQVNPTWHVPQSIIYNEYLPALQQDPSMLERMGLVMERKRDGSIAIRQPPGERNALGRIKFNFPNRYQVYLHDTPDKSLFGHERRAYSHGCMRVQNPTQFGEALLSIGGQPAERFSAQKLQSMYGSGERWLKFKTSVPVHLVYFNAYVDDAGELVVRDDIYGYDKRVQIALGGGPLPAIAERSQVVKPQRAANNAAGPRYDPRRRYDERVAQDQWQRPSFFPFPFFR